MVAVIVLTVDEVIARYRCTRRALLKMIRQSNLPVLNCGFGKRLAAGNIRFDEEAILALEKALKDRPSSHGAQILPFLCWAEKEKELT